MGMMRTFANQSRSFFKGIFSHRKFFIGFVLFVCGIFLLDQGTKWATQKAFLQDFSPVRIHSYRPSEHELFRLGQAGENTFRLSLTYVRNTGSAWGFLGGMPEKYRVTFFGTVTLLALCFLFFLIFKENQSLHQNFSIVLIFSGALGNFFDRVYLHYVIDMIHAQWSIFGWSYDYPVFNVADMCVTIGVLTLVVGMLRTKNTQ